MKISGKTFNFGKICIGIIMVIALSGLFTACIDTESDLEKRMKADDERITSYLTENNIDATKHDKGFYFQKLTENTSGQTLQTGDVIDFYYKISLLDGTLIDESIESRDTISQIRLGYWAVVPIGLDIGISIMRTGEKFRFFMPSYLAYDYISSGKIESYSNFIIDIEVLDKKTETEINDAQIDSIQHYVDTSFTNYEKFATGLYYIPETEGTGEKPFSNSKVTINFTRKYLNGRVIKKTPDGQPSVFYLNNNQAVQGLEEGLLQMKQGGKATLIMPASIGFMESVCVIPESMRGVLLNLRVINTEVIPYSIIMYNVELVSVNDY
jgi:FKBP-type peptidyl-prolyl cis-trans isomerase FkpA